MRRYLRGSGQRFEMVEQDAAQPFASLSASVSVAVVVVSVVGIQTDALDRLAGTISMTTSPPW